MKLKETVDAWLKHMDHALLEKYSRQHDGVDIVAVSKEYATVKGDPDRSAYRALKLLAVALCVGMVWILIMSIYRQPWYLVGPPTFFPVLAVHGYMCFVLRPRQAVVMRCEPVLTEFCATMGQLDRLGVGATRYNTNWLGDIGVALARNVLMAENEYNKLCREGAGEVEKVVEAGRNLIKKRKELDEILALMSASFNNELDKRRLFEEAGDRIRDAAKSL